MRTSDLFFIIVVAIVCVFGMIAAYASHQSPVGIVDSNGNTTSMTTNATERFVGNVTAVEAQITGEFILFVAVILVVLIVIGGMMLLKKGKFGGGRYRTG